MLTDIRTYGHTDIRTYGHTDIRTHGHTDIRTDRPSYRDARTHLKKWHFETKFTLWLFIDPLQDASYQSPGLFELPVSFLEHSFIFIVMCRLRPLAYPGTNLFMVCFSVERESSFENIKQKVSLKHQNKPEPHTKTRHVWWLILIFPTLPVHPVGTRSAESCA